MQVLIFLNIGESVLEGDQQMAQEKELLALSVEEAAELLGISKGLMYEAVRMGQIPHIRIGRRVIIPRLALLKMLEGENRRSNESVS